MIYARITHIATSSDIIFFFLLKRKSKQIQQILMNITCLSMLRNHMPFLRVQIKFTFLLRNFSSWCRGISNGEKVHMYVWNFLGNFTYVDEKSSV